MGIKSEDSALTSGGAGAAPSMPQAVRDVLAERRRQIEVEGWSPDHDDASHDTGHLATAAACYALGVPRVGGGRYNHPSTTLWPWGEEWWKPKDRRSNLVRAAALILAEIERLDRAALLTDGAAPDPSKGQAVQNLTDPASPSPKEER